MASPIQNGTSSAIPFDPPLHPTQPPLPKPPSSFIRRFWETQRSALGNVALALSCGILALRMIGLQRQLEAEVAAANQREAEMEGKLAEKDEENQRLIAWVRREAEQGGFDLGRRLLTRIGGDYSSVDNAAKAVAVEFVHQGQSTSVTKEPKGETAEPAPDVTPTGGQMGWLSWVFGSAKQQPISDASANGSKSTSKGSITNREKTVEGAAPKQTTTPPQETAGTSSSDIEKPPTRFLV